VIVYPGSLDLVDVLFTLKCLDCFLFLSSPMRVKRCLHITQTTQKETGRASRILHFLDAFLIVPSLLL